jgi:hypothetical protein
MNVKYKHEARKLTLDEFLGEKGPSEVEELVGKFNGGAFMCCHTQIFAETGIWIEELVPAFQRLDAHLAISSQETVKELSPDFA